MLSSNLQSQASDIDSILLRRMKTIASTNHIYLIINPVVVMNREIHIQLIKNVYSINVTAWDHWSIWRSWISPIIRHWMSLDAA